MQERKNFFQISFCPYLSKTRTAGGPAGIDHGTLREALRQNLFHDIPMYVSEAEITTGVAESQLLMI